jgi:head-tail adaptor
MDIGQLRHRVTLTNPGTPVADGDGGYTETFTALSPATVSAAIKPATARDLERVAGGTVMSTASHLITMRFHPGVTTETKVAWTTKDGRTHTANVTGVQNTDERSIELVLTCVEVVA